MGDGRPDRSRESLTDQLVEVVMTEQLLTWADLAAHVGEPTTSAALLDATRRRAFTRTALVAASSRRTGPPEPEALVFQIRDLPRVAASGRLWRLAFRYLRGRSTHLHSEGELKAAFKPAALKDAFGRALKEALQRRVLPTGIGAVLRRGRFYFLLQDDLLAPPRSAPVEKAVNETGFPEAFEAAFSKLDAATGRNNFVKLLSLRRALPQFSRAVFDRQLNALRRAGRFSLDAAEGTHDRTTSEEREAGILEAGRRLVYCARR